MTGDERHQGMETDGRIGAQSPPIGRFTSFTPLTTPID